MGSIGFEIDIEFDKFAEQIKNRGGEHYADKLENYMAFLGAMGAVYARSLAPVKTGTLRGAIGQQTIRKKDVITTTIYSDMPSDRPYNIYQEYGTGLAGLAGEIHPRAKSRLRDDTTKLSYSMFNGHGAQPFMHPTADYIAKKFNTNVVYKGVFDE